MTVDHPDSRHRRPPGRSDPDRADHPDRGADQGLRRARTSGPSTSLDLEVGTGEIFGLLGPNGAGKTTTAGMLTTRVDPDRRARPSWAASTWSRHPALAKQILGIVSQQNTLDRQLTVWENLYFHGRLFGIPAKESRREADRLLEQFQLDKWAKASVYALSGGMAQRLMVARAIFHRPAVLFLDEPTAGLDPQSRLALWEILRELNAERADHPPHHPLHGGGRPALRPGGHHGQGAGSWPSTRRPPSRARSTPTPSSPSPPPATADALAGRSAERIPGVTRTRPIDGGVELHVKGKDRLLPAVVTGAEDAGFPVLDLSVTEPTLETVFINLTGKELRD